MTTSICMVSRATMLTGQYMPRHAGAGGFVVGAAQPLFKTNNTDESRVFRNSYTAASDGQRFLVMSPLIGPNVSPLVAVINWTAAIGRKP